MTSPEHSSRQDDGLDRSLEALASELEGLEAQIGELNERLAAERAQRERAEGELRASERRYRDFADCAADWFWETDAGLRLTYLSRKFETATGAAVNRLLGKTLRELTTEEQRAAEPEVWSHHFEALAHRRPFTRLELAIETRKGRRLHVQLAGKPVFDGDAQFVGYRGSARDVTAYKEAEAMLMQQSAFDGLTGIANRRRFDEFLEHEWHSAERAAAPLALILVDVDYFKAFNDHYGHSAGDACLAAVARVLEEGLRRKVDLAARYGGEEFACVLPGTDLAGAAVVAERLRRDVERLRIEHARSEAAGHVTISVGVATTKPTAGQAPGALVATADERLYDAKRGGRNRVVSAAQPRTVVPIDRSS